MDSRIRSHAHFALLCVKNDIAAKQRVEVFLGAAFRRATYLKHFFLFYVCFFGLHSSWLGQHRKQMPTLFWLFLPWIKKGGKPASEIRCCKSALEKNRRFWTCTAPSSTFEKKCRSPFLLALINVSPYNFKFFIRNFFAWYVTHHIRARTSHLSFVKGFLASRTVVCEPYS